MPEHLVSFLESVIYSPFHMVVETSVGSTEVLFDPSKFEQPSDGSLENHAKEKRFKVIETIKNSGLDESFIEIRAIDYMDLILKKEYAQALSHEMRDHLLSLQPLLKQSVLLIKIRADNCPVLIKDFTKREKDILKALMQGSSQKKIALAFGISPFTVNDHLKSIYKKMEVTSRGEALSKARQWVIK